MQDLLLSQKLNPIFMIIWQFPVKSDKIYYVKENYIYMKMRVHTSKRPNSADVLYLTYLPLSGPLISTI